MIITARQDVKPPFIVDVVNENDDQKEFDMIDEDGDDDADEDDCFDSVCSICDNGGNLYMYVYLDSNYTIKRCIC